MYSIYQLIDPRDRCPRYVGMTIGLQARFQQHTQADGSNPAKDAWVAELKEQGLIPAIEVLERLTSKADAQEREACWIRSLHNQGVPLFNRSGVSEETATVEVSLYLRPSQDDKLEELRRAYKQRTKKKISANEVMRRLIEQATVEQIISKP